MNAAQQSIKDAELQIGNAKITLNNQQKQYDMQKTFAQGVISKQEYYNAEQQYKGAAQSVSIAEQQLRTAEKRLQIARTGSTPELQSLATTQVRSKLNGTILEIPVKKEVRLSKQITSMPGQLFVLLLTLILLFLKVLLMKLRLED